MISYIKRKAKTTSGLLVMIMVMFTVILGLSYGTFVITTSDYKASEMMVSNLMYGISITGTGGSESINGTTVTLGSGSTSTVLVKITSLNNVDSNYSLEYKITSGTGNIYYATSTGWMPTGEINRTGGLTFEKTVRVVIYATSDLVVDFNVFGGYIHNDSVASLNGYNKITESYDYIYNYTSASSLMDIIKTQIDCSGDCIYGGQSINNYLQYPTNDDKTLNLWRIIGSYDGIGIKVIRDITSSVTQGEISESLTNFYNALEEPTDYILSTDKFNCSSEGCTSSSYSNVGLLSIYEYNLIGGSDSYLGIDESYFALNDTSLENITSTGIESTTSTTSSGLRPTVYLLDDVEVIGSGTLDNPFVLQEPMDPDISLASATLNGEALGYFPTGSDPYIANTVSCTNGSVGYYDNETMSIELTTVNLPTTCTVDYKEGYSISLIGKNVTVEAPVSKVVGTDGVVTYNLIEQSGYDLTGASVYCAGFSTPSINGSDVTISNITENDTCEVSVEPGTYTVSYQVTDLDMTIKSNEVTFGKTYGDLPKPSREGYTLEWYTSSTGGTKVTEDTIVEIAGDHTLYARWIEHPTVTLAVNSNATITSTNPMHSDSLTGGSTTFTVTPNAGYELTGITCANGSVGTIIVTNVKVSNITQNDTCTITVEPYEILTFKDRLLRDNPVRLTRSDFSIIFTDVNIGTLYTQGGNWTEDVTGDGVGETVYYFAGNAQNNWVKFGKNSSGADLYWRIIRTNEDDGVRLLYIGTAKNTTSASIGTSTFNGTSTSNTTDASVGYMYGTSGSLENHRTNTTDSTIKGVVDSWYRDGLNTKTDGTYTYDSYVSKTAIYCNDRSTDAWSSNTYFGTYRRLTNNKPSYKCGNDATGTLYSTVDVADKFSVSTTNGGNGKLTYPVALITADELLYAAGAGSYVRFYPWIYYNSEDVKILSTCWWTMSPGYIYSSSRYGYYSCPAFPARTESVYSSYYVRPVISIKSCAKVTAGNGSSETPYELTIDSACAAVEN